MPTDLSNFIRNADLILCHERWYIIEQGNHEELMEQGRLYAGPVTTVNLTEDEAEE